MLTESKMVLLGRRGGLLGGAARAAALTPERRSEIARAAARTRWNGTALVFDRRPRDHGELLSFVAYYGTDVSRVTTKCSLENIVLRALRSARRSPNLARMLPVFLWRVREELDLGRMAKKAATKSSASALGYFLELTADMGSFKGFDSTVAKLRSRALRRPTYFFDRTAKNPFEAMVAHERTPKEAMEWGLLTGTPTDSFESHFRKMVD